MWERYFKTTKKYTKTDFYKKALWSPIPSLQWLSLKFLIITAKRKICSYSGSGYLPMQCGQCCMLLLLHFRWKRGIERLLRRLMICNCNTQTFQFKLYCSQFSRRDLELRCSVIAWRVLVSKDGFIFAFFHTYFIVFHGHLLLSSITAIKKYVWHTRNILNPINCRCVGGCRRKYNETFFYKIKLKNFVPMIHMHLRTEILSTFF